MGLQHNEPTGWEWGLKAFAMFNSGMSQIFTSPPDDASRNFVVILAFLTPSFTQSVLFLHVVLREVIDIRHKPNITAIFLFAITHLPMILFAIFLSTDQQFIGLRAYSAMVLDSSLDLDTLYSIHAEKWKTIRIDIVAPDAWPWGKIQKKGDVAGAWKTETGRSSWRRFLNLRLITATPLNLPVHSTTHREQSCKYVTVFSS